MEFLEENSRILLPFSNFRFREAKHTAQRLNQILMKSWRRAGVCRIFLTSTFSRARPLTHRLSTIFHRLCTKFPFSRKKDLSLLESFDVRLFTLRNCAFLLGPLHIFMPLPGRVIWHFLHPWRKMENSHKEMLLLYLGVLRQPSP